jgi:hypothetical protein
MRRGTRQFVAMRVAGSSQTMEGAAFVSKCLTELRDRFIIWWNPPRPSSSVVLKFHPPPAPCLLFPDFTHLLVTGCFESHFTRSLRRLYYAIYILTHSIVRKSFLQIKTVKDIVR